MTPVLWKATALLGSASASIGVVIAQVSDNGLNATDWRALALAAVVGGPLIVWAVRFFTAGSKVAAADLERCRAEVARLHGVLAQKDAFIFDMLAAFANEGLVPPAPPTTLAEEEQ